MELIVDLDKVTVVLGRAGDLDELVVRIEVPTEASARTQERVHRLGDVLQAASVGELLDARRAVVRTDALAFHAAGQVDVGWEDRLRARFGGGSELEARVVWPEDGGRDDTGARAERPGSARQVGDVWDGGAIGEA